MGTVLSMHDDCRSWLIQESQNGYKSKIFYKKYIPIDEFVEKSYTIPKWLLCQT